MRVLLDTQAIVLGYLGDLPQKIRDLLSSERTELVASTASILEIAAKNTIGKLDMPEGETRRALRELRLSVLPFEPRHAFRMFSLPPHHRDPFDRMILATALVESLPIISGDRVFRQYKDAEVI